ncbi:MAG: hypothetical protein CMI17_00855 [Opitutaceae bacterium]|nr:hypothetical protein [Opitutaceae bacterium]
MSKKSDLEMNLLTEALIFRFKTLIETYRNHTILAAGTTRLGKIEFINVSNWHSCPICSTLHLEESLLIRVRQNRYSSAGIIAKRLTEAESTIQIHLEYQSRCAQAFQIPYREKRPRFIRLGTPIRKEVSPRWFNNPSNETNRPKNFLALI